MCLLVGELFGTEAKMNVDLYTFYLAYLMSDLVWYGMVYGLWPMVFVCNLWVEGRRHSSGFNMPWC